MSIGYACINIGSNKTKMFSVTLKNVSAKKLRLIIDKNLDALKSIIEYNIQNKIGLYRISSDIIPFGSHPANSLDWKKEFEVKLNSIGTKIKSSGMRVSMHPGQYTVLNSIDDGVVKRAVEDLVYHSDFLDALGCDSKSKIILHIGGVYNDKENAVKRFIQNYKSLDNKIKKRLVIENDDKSYNIAEVLNISKTLGIPVVFDNLHHELNRPKEHKNEAQWIELCAGTWSQQDGKQKIHYSQPNPNGKPGAHSDFISSKEFLAFFNGLTKNDIDIMLEVKDKNISAVKCNLLVKKDLKIKELEIEWARYKYLTLSRSSAIYNSIRELLKDKQKPAPIKFYEFIEEAMKLEEYAGAEVNAAQHVWGYLNKKATTAEENRYQKLITGYTERKNSIVLLKNHMYRCAVKQNSGYLIDSYYFYL